MLQVKVLCLDQSEDPLPPPAANSAPVAGSNFDTVNNTCSLIGSNFTGEWSTRRAFTITAGPVHMIES